MKQCLDEKVFNKVKLFDLPQHVVLVDATQGHTGLKEQAGTQFGALLDLKKPESPTRSSTATRLRPRLMLSMAATCKFNIKAPDGCSWCVLQGFS